MYDDLIKGKSKSIIWDFEQYEKKAYCPSCGSTDVTAIRDHLSSQTLTKDIKCNFCSQQWKEVWNKNIELELKECII
jgi:formate dehydrogenase maturation protein FdhE